MRQRLWKKIKRGRAWEKIKRKEGTKVTTFYNSFDKQGNQAYKGSNPIFSTISFVLFHSKIFFSPPRSIVSNSSIDFAKKHTLTW